MSNSAINKVVDKLVDAASQPYRQSGKFGWHFARGKLGQDPVFEAILALDLLPQQGRVLDIGCGQGLLAAWLLSAQHQHAQGQWPSGWPAPPQVRQIHGIELMPRDISRAQQALQQYGVRSTFEVGNMCSADFGSAEAVVLLDVLHYVDFPGQDDVLKRVHACLGKDGVLLLRVGDAAGGLPFKISNWVDHIVTMARRSHTPPLYCRTLDAWQAAIVSLGFSLRVIPMNKGTPFANFLLVCKKG
jgi:2-polyprenyl-3-methyl-5-hydroxy-6-metoxy-1,4-benzoquinol methylase